MERLINYPPKKMQLPKYKKWIQCICDISSYDIPLEILLIAKFITNLLVINHNLHTLSYKAFYETFIRQLVIKEDPDCVLYFDKYNLNYSFLYSIRLHHLNELNIVKIFDKQLTIKPKRNGLLITINKIHNHSIYYINDIVYHCFRSEPTERPTTPQDLSVEDAEVTGILSQILEVQTKDQAPTKKKYSWLRNSPRLSRPVEVATSKRRASSTPPAIQEWQSDFSTDAESSDSDKEDDPHHKRICRDIDREMWKGALEPIPPKRTRQRTNIVTERTYTNLDNCGSRNVSVINISHNDQSDEQTGLQAEPASILSVTREQALSPEPMKPCAQVYAEPQPAQTMEEAQPAILITVNTAQQDNPTEEQKPKATTTSARLTPFHQVVQALEYPVTIPAPATQTQSVALHTAQVRHKTILREIEDNTIWPTAPVPMDTDYAHPCDETNYQLPWDMQPPQLDLTQYRLYAAYEKLVNKNVLPNTNQPCYSFETGMPYMNKACYSKILADDDPIMFIPAHNVRERL